MVDKEIVCKSRYICIFDDTIVLFCCKEFYKSAFVGLRRLWKRKGKWRTGNEIKEIEEDGYEGKNCVH